MLCLYLNLPGEQAILITLFGGFLLRLWQSGSAGKCLNSFTTDEA